MKIFCVFSLAEIFILSEFRKLWGAGSSSCALSCADHVRIMCGCILVAFCPHPRFFLVAKGKNSSNARLDCEMRCRQEAASDRVACVVRLDVWFHGRIMRGVMCGSCAASFRPNSGSKRSEQR